VAGEPALTGEARVLSFAGLPRLKSLRGLRAKSALVLGDYGFPYRAIPGTGALFAMQLNGWDVP